jgi:phosphoribosylanthranilate isomerase
MNVKICGLRRKEEALWAAQAGVDAVGVVFANSPRRVDVVTARDILAVLPPFVSRVGVFVKERQDVVRDIAANCGLTVLQMHGEEDAEYCQRFTLPVIRAIRVRERRDLDLMNSFPAAAFLLDTYQAGKLGGTGSSFDWSLAAVSGRAPVLVAGGLTAQNVVSAIKLTRPYGVDVSSGVERDGIKDEQLMRAFVGAAKGWG